MIVEISDWFVLTPEGCHRLDELFIPSGLDLYKARKMVLNEITTYKVKYNNRCALLATSMELVKRNIKR